MFAPIFSSAFVGLGLTLFRVGGQEFPEKPVPSPAPEYYCKCMPKDDFAFISQLQRVVRAPCLPWVRTQRMP